MGRVRDKAECSPGGRLAGTMEGMVGGCGRSAKGVAEAGDGMAEAASDHDAGWAWHTKWRVEVEVGKRPAA